MKKINRIRSVSSIKDSEIIDKYIFLGHSNASGKKTKRAKTPDVDQKKLMLESIDICEDKKTKYTVARNIVNYFKKTKDIHNKNSFNFEFKNGSFGLNNSINKNQKPQKIPKDEKENISPQCLPFSFKTYLKKKIRKNEKADFLSRTAAEQKQHKEKCSEKSVFSKHSTLNSDSSLKKNFIFNLRKILQKNEKPTKQDINGYCFKPFFHKVNPFIRERRKSQRLIKKYEDLTKEVDSFLEKNKKYICDQK